MVVVIKLCIEFEQNGSRLKRESGVVGDLYKSRAAKRNGRVSHSRDNPRILSRVWKSVFS